MIAPVELLVSPEMSPKTSTSMTTGEPTSEFLMVLETTASDRAASPDMLPFTMPSPIPQAASNAEEEAEAVHLSQPTESTPPDSAFAPFLLLRVLVPPQLDMAPTDQAPITPTNAFDDLQRELGQIPENAASISSQVSPTPSSAKSLTDTGQRIPHISPPQLHQVAQDVLSFAMPTSVDAAGAAMVLASVMDNAPVGNSQITSADRSNSHPETTPIALQAVDRLAHAATMAEHSLVAEAFSFPDSVVAGIENVQVSVSNPPLLAPADTPLEFHSVPSPGNSAVSLCHLSADGQQAPLTVEMVGDMDITADPGLLGEDHYDAPDSGDREAPVIPQTRNLAPSDMPSSYTEAAQRASVIQDTAVTTVHPGPADQRGIYVEPKPVMTQLIDHLRVAVRGEQQELSVQLAPEHLGTVRVNILADQLEVHARLLVDNAAVKEALEANLHKLREALQAQGLLVQDISISVNHQAPQHESMAGRFSSEERRWKSSRGPLTSESTGAISAVSGRGILTTDLRQVDLFA